jgi:hypothetical protein
MIRNNASLKRILDYYYAQPDFKVMLLLGAETLTPTATLQDFLAKEVRVDGYSRRPIVFGVAAVNEPNAAIEFGEQSITFTAGSTLPIQFDGFAVIRAGAATPQALVNSIALNNPTEITFANTPGAIGQQGFFVSSGTLPSGMSAGAIYAIASITSNTAIFYNVATSAPLVLTDTGFGALRWLPLAGTIEAPFDLRPADSSGNRIYTIQPNQSHVVRVKLGLKVG